VKIYEFYSNRYILIVTGSSEMYSVQNLSMRKKDQSINI